MGITSCLAATGGVGGAIIPVAVLAVVVGMMLVVVARARRARRAAVFAAIALVMVAVSVGSPTMARAAEPTGLGTTCSMSSPAQQLTPLTPAAVTPTPPVSPVGASIGDRVWVDSNDNGLQDADEQSLAGAVLTLLDDATGLPVTTGVDGMGFSATQTTGADGRYLFAGLNVGTYRVRFEPSPAIVADKVTVGDIGPAIAIDFSAFAQIFDSNGIMISTFYLHASKGGCYNGVSEIHALGLGHTYRVIAGGVDVTDDPRIGPVILIDPAGDTVSGLTAPQAVGEESNSDFDRTTRETSAPIAVGPGQAVTDIDAGVAPQFFFTSGGAPC